MEKDIKSCCSPRRSGHGFAKGLLSGLLPHSFCIAFIAATLAGSVFGAAIARKFLLIPHFFAFLVILSLVFATLSAVIYLRRCRCLSKEGLKRKWKYLSILYGTTITVNLLFIYLVFPAVLSLPDRGYAPAAAQAAAQAAVSARLDISVDIPCSGHASLIRSELQKVPGITAIAYEPLRTFHITYDPKTVSEADILSLEIFQEYKATKI